VESLFKLYVADGHKASILQSPIPIFIIDKHQTLLGINTYRYYQAVLDAIQEQRRELNLIVGTGDLAQDH
jgi:Icc protein